MDDEISPRPLMQAVGKVAAAKRHGSPPEVLEAAQRELNAARLEEAIDKALTDEPVITTDDQRRLAMKLLPGSDVL